MSICPRESRNWLCACITNHSLLFLSLFLTHSLTHILTHSWMRTRTHTHTHSYALLHSRTHSHRRGFPPNGHVWIWLPCAWKCRVDMMPKYATYLSLSPSLFHFQVHLYSHTHTRTHTHTHAHTRTRMALEYADRVCDKKWISPWQTEQPNPVPMSMPMPTPTPKLPGSLATEKSLISFSFFPPKMFLSRNKIRGQSRSTHCLTSGSKIGWKGQIEKISNIDISNEMRFHRLALATFEQFLGPIEGAFSKVLIKKSFWNELILTKQYSKFKKVTTNTVVLK